MLEEDEGARSWRILLDEQGVGRRCDRGSSWTRVLEEDVVVGPLGPGCCTCKKMSWWRYITPTVEL